MSAPGKAGAIQPVKVRPKLKGSVLLGSECCVATGDSGCEVYTAIAWDVGLSHERSDIAGAESSFKTVQRKTPSGRATGCPRPSDGAIFSLCARPRLARERRAGLERSRR